MGVDVHLGVGVVAVPRLEADEHRPGDRVPHQQDAGGGLGAVDRHDRVGHQRVVLLAGPRQVDRVGGGHRHHQHDQGDEGARHAQHEREPPAWHPQAEPERRLEEVVGDQDGHRHRGDPHAEERPEPEPGALPVEEHVDGQVEQVDPVGGHPEVPERRQAEAPHDEPGPGAGARHDDQRGAQRVEDRATAEGERVVQPDVGDEPPVADRRHDGAPRGEPHARSLARTAGRRGGQHERRVTPTRISLARGRWRSRDPDVPVAGGGDHAARTTPRPAPRRRRRRHPTAAG